MAKNSKDNPKSLPTIPLVNQPKVAIFYDWLNQWGGAEKVLLDILAIFPHATLYTLVHDPQKTPWLPQNQKIITSFINNLPGAKRNPIFYTPFYIIALEQFNFSDFDIIISTTSTIGHALLTPPSSLFICYFHNINRYLYNTPKKYSLLKPLLNIYKKADQIFKHRPDFLFCNSKTVQARIKKYYQLQAQIINPGVDLTLFTPLPKTQKPLSYFLVVSRLVPHKKIDLAIKACAQLKLNLKIVGIGRQKRQLQNLIKKLGAKNITLLGTVSQKKLIRLYQHCQCLICPQFEDYGITPIEAQACGRPVIAYNQGGITETVIPNKTGLFFDKQTTSSLINTLKTFNLNDFNQTDCINNSKRFSDKNFMLNFNKSVLKLWLEKTKTTTS